MALTPNLIFEEQSQSRFLYRKYAAHNPEINPAKGIKDDTACFFDAADSKVFGMR